MCQGRIRLNIRDNFFMERVFKQQNRLSRVMAASPFLEAFKKCVDVALGDMGYGGLGSAGVMVGFDDLRGHFQPK